MTPLAAFAARSVAPAARIAIAALFIATGIAKIVDPPGFLAAMLTYHLPFSATPLELAAVIIPWFELLTGLILAAGIWVDAGLVAASGLSILFVAVAAQAAVRGLSVQCGCFGALSEGMPSFLNSLPFVLGRDLLLAGITLTLTWRHLRSAPSVSRR